MSQIAAKTYEPTPARKVAFLGLGVMGYPMAGHLARAGHHVTVYNRSAAKAAAWTAECPGNASAPTPREAVGGADIVFACVGNDADLRSVVLGADGAFAGMKPGAIFVDHTTASAEMRSSPATSTPVTAPFTPDERKMRVTGALYRIVTPLSVSALAKPLAIECMPPSGKYTPSTESM